MAETLHMPDDHPYDAGVPLPSTPDPGKSPGGSPKLPRRSPGQMYRSRKAALGLCAQGGCHLAAVEGKAACRDHLRRDADAAFVRRHPPGGDYSPGVQRRLRQIAGEPEPVTEHQRRELAYNGEVLRRSQLQAAQADAARAAQAAAAALATARRPLENAQADVDTARQAVRAALDAAAVVDRAIARGELDYAAATQKAAWVASELAAASAEAADFENRRDEQAQLASRGGITAGAHERAGLVAQRRATSATEKANRIGQRHDDARRSLLDLDAHAAALTAANSALGASDRRLAAAAREAREPAEPLVLPTPLADLPGSCPVPDLGAILPFTPSRLHAVRGRVRRSERPGVVAILGVGSNHVLRPERPGAVAVVGRRPPGRRPCRLRALMASVSVPPPGTTRAVPLAHPLPSRPATAARPLPSPAAVSAAVLPALCPSGPLSAALPATRRLLAYLSCPLSAALSWPTYRPLPALPSDPFACPTGPQIPP